MANNQSHGMSPIELPSGFFVKEQKKMKDLLKVCFFDILESKYTVYLYLIRFFLWYILSVLIF